MEAAKDSLSKKGDSCSYGSRCIQIILQISESLFCQYLTPREYCYLRTLSFAIFSLCSRVGFQKIIDDAMSEKFYETVKRMVFSKDDGDYDRALYLGDCIRPKRIMDNIKIFSTLAYVSDTVGDIFDGVSGVSFGDVSYERVEMLREMGFYFKGADENCCGIHKCGTFLMVPEDDASSFCITRRDEGEFKLFDRDANVLDAHIWRHNTTQDVELISTKRETEHIIDLLDDLGIDTSPMTFGTVLIDGTLFFSLSGGYKLLHDCFISGSNCIICRLNNYNMLQYISNCHFCKKGDRGTSKFVVCKKTEELVDHLLSEIKRAPYTHKSDAPHVRNPQREKLFVAILYNVVKRDLVRIPTRDSVDKRCNADRSCDIDKMCGSEKTIDNRVYLNPHEELLMLKLRIIYRDFHPHSEMVMFNGFTYSMHTAGITSFPENAMFQKWHYGEKGSYVSITGKFNIFSLDRLINWSLVEEMDKERYEPHAFNRYRRFEKEESRGTVSRSVYREFYEEHKE